MLRLEEAEQEFTFVDVPEFRAVSLPRGVQARPRSDTQIEAELFDQITHAYF